MKPIALTSNLIFLRSLLLDPKSIGALAPSSPQLARFIAGCVGSRNQSVLEIGAGTGAITTELVRKAVDPANLLVMERDARLARLLRETFPEVRVRCGDALHCREFLAEPGVRGVQTIVSSLPLRNMEPGQREAVADAMLSALPANGQLIQYTYAPFCPIRVNPLEFSAECAGRVWTNLPPASVWRFVRR